MVICHNHTTDRLTWDSYLYSTFNNSFRFKTSCANALPASILSSSSIGNLQNANEYSEAYGLSEVKAGGRVARRVDGTVWKGKKMSKFSKKKKIHAKRSSR